MSMYLWEQTVTQNYNDEIENKSIAIIKSGISVNLGLTLDYSLVKEE